MAVEDLIIKYIIKEIRFHDCIIIPGFGGFIGSYESAYFDPSKGKYFPPSKALIFNTAIKNNDGLLAAIMKDGENISYVSALTIIDNTIDVWKKELESGHRIEVGDMGYVYKSKLGHIQFYQNKAINLYPGSFGLSAISVVGSQIREYVAAPVEVQETEQVAVARVVEETSQSKEPVSKPKITSAPIISLNAAETIENEPQEKQPEELIHPATKSFRFNKKYLVAASFASFLFYSYWIPAKTDFLKTGKIQVSDFNPFVTPSKSEYSPRTTFLTEEETIDFISVDTYLKTLPADTKTFSYPYDEDYYIPVKLEAKPVEIADIHIKEKHVKEDSSSPIKKSASTGNYHLIAGCFGEKSNAEQLVKTMQAKGYKAQILDYNKGLHRVSAQSFKSKEEANSFLIQLKSDGVSAWVLKK